MPVEPTCLFRPALPRGVATVPRATADVSPGGRIVRDSQGWATIGRARKHAARGMGRCVECFAPLAGRRRLYCSSGCEWKFHGRFFWDAARVVVFRRDRYTCRACLRRFPRRQLEVDHIVEIARGGPSLDYANLQTLCKRCHRGKTRGFLVGRSRGRTADLTADPDASDWFPG